MAFREQFSSACIAKSKELGRKLVWAEVLELACECHAKAPKEKTPRSKPVSEMSDEEWIKSLEAEPALKGINVRQEIGRAQFWCKNNKRVPTRRFLVNWLNKAEKVVDLKAMGATHATGLRPPPPKGPEGWLQWLDTELASISTDHPAHGQLTAARNCQAFHLLPASWQARCLATSFTALPREVDSTLHFRTA